jgi:hypothetical protein
MRISLADSQSIGFMKWSDAQQGNAESRAAEALAQSLYEAEDPAGSAWAKRTPIVREPWLLRARQQLRAGSAEAAAIPK